MTSPSALHSKATPKWGTPEGLVALARICLDNRIDLDPASSPDFNKIVQAARILTETEDGLRANWLLQGQTSLHVFLNPPGGLVKDFWNRLIDHVADNRVTKAIWIGFSVEQLCTLQDCEFYPMDFATCILRKRVAFTKESGEPGGSPSHGNYVSALGIDRQVFSDCFSSLGKIHFGDLA